MGDEIEAVAALADPVRRSLYEHVVGADGPVSREEAATGAGVAAHSARFHLDRLVEEGLLEVEYRRLTGRSGPGAGRPAKLYRRSSREVAVSLPHRSYDLVGSILAAAVDRTLGGAELEGSLAEVAREHGRALADGCARPVAGDAATAELEAVADALDGEGFEPSLSGRRVCLRNCPFDALAKTHTALVCGLNLRFVDGVVEGLGCDEVEARLDPAEDRCCVVVEAR